MEENVLTAKEVAFDKLDNLIFEFDADYESQLPEEWFVSKDDTHILLSLGRGASIDRVWLKNAGRPVLIGAVSSFRYPDGYKFFAAHETYEDALASIVSEALPKETLKLMAE